MTVFYLARIPDPGTFCFQEGTTIRRLLPDGQLSPPGQLGLNLLGRFSATHKDVCAEYYRRAGRRPPYLALNECGRDPSAIAAFTAKWGILTEDRYIPNGWLSAIGKQWCPWKGDKDDFLMDITGWLHLQDRFRRMLEIATKPNRRGIEELDDLITSGIEAGFDAGQIRLGLQWHKKGVEPQIRTDSLYLAFVSMLWLDVSFRSRRVTRCADPECANYFSTDRANKIYCSTECALRVSRRNWWRRSGQKWRNRRREGI